MPAADIAAPDEPTVSSEVQPLAPEASPPEQPVDDTPAWKRASNREEALQALLDDEELPLDAVTKHSKIAGVIGTHAKRQAQQLQRDSEAAAREQRRRELAAGGHTAELGADVAGDYVSDPARMARDQATNELSAEAQRELGTILARLPKESQQKLSERATDGAYSGTFGEGLRTWVDDLAAELLAAELPKAVDKEIRKRDLIPRAVAEAERVSELGSPDVRRGGGAGTQDFETEMEMATAFAAGDIDQQQMTSWYRRHRR